MVGGKHHVYFDAARRYRGCIDKSVAVALEQAAVKITSHDHFDIVVACSSVIRDIARSAQFN